MVRNKRQEEPPGFSPSDCALTYVSVEKVRTVSFEENRTS